MVERHNCHSNRSVEKQKKMMTILMNMVFKPGSADEPSQYLAIMGDYDDDNAYGWTQRSSPILSLPCSRWMVVVTCDSTVSLTHISNSYFRGWTKLFFDSKDRTPKNYKSFVFVLMFCYGSFMTFNDWDWIKMYGTNY